MCDKFLQRKKNSLSLRNAFLKLDEISFFIIVHIYIYIIKTRSKLLSERIQFFITKFVIILYFIGIIVPI